MKTRIIGIIVLVLMALGSVGCSSPRQGVYYLGNKTYAKDPKTGKINTWENRPSEENNTDEYDSADGASFVTGLLDWAVN